MGRIFTSSSKLQLQIRLIKTGPKLKKCNPVFTNYGKSVSLAVKTIDDLLDLAAKLQKLEAI